MSGPLAKLERTVADLEASIARARELLPELHGAVKDARHAVREIDEAVDRARARIASGVDDMVTAEVRRQLDLLGDATRKAMDESVDKVGREFDRLAAILLGTEGDDKPSLEDLVRKRAAAKPRPFVAAYEEPGDGAYERALRRAQESDGRKERDDGTSSESQAGAPSA